MRIDEALDVCYTVGAKTFVGGGALFLAPSFLFTTAKGCAQRAPHHGGLTSPAERLSNDGDHDGGRVAFNARGTSNMKICSTCKQNKLESEFNKDRSGPDGLAYRCKECRHACQRAKRQANNEEENAKATKWRNQNREHFNTYSRLYNREYRKTHKYPRPEYTRRRSAILKAEYVQLAGGCCQRCGYHEFISGLAFHHVDESTKIREPSEVIIGGNRRREDALFELDKCCLLCHNCHVARHAQMWLESFVKRNDFGWTL